jgi:hypothetical protein
VEENILKVGLAGSHIGNGYARRPHGIEKFLHAVLARFIADDQPALGINIAPPSGKLRWYHRQRFRWRNDKLLAVEAVQEL